MSRSKTFNKLIKISDKTLITRHFYKKNKNILEVIKNRTISRTKNVVLKYESFTEFLNYECSEKDYMI